MALPQRGFVDGGRTQSRNTSQRDRHCQKEKSAYSYIYISIRRSLCDSSCPFCNAAVVTSRTCLQWLVRNTKRRNMTSRSVGNPGAHILCFLLLRFWSHCNKCNFQHTNRSLLPKQYRRRKSLLEASRFVFVAHWHRACCSQGHLIPNYRRGGCSLYGKKNKDACVHRVFESFKVPFQRRNELRKGRMVSFC